ncbi:MAG: response regulator [Cyclonatronaceae bacterium]
MTITAGNHTIMTVDDTVENLNLLEDMLSGAGFRVVQFPRGTLAIQAALRNPPDLMLLDVMMPVMDGYEVCRRLKAHERLRDIPVIFVSALGDAESKVRAFSEGGVDYVTKPFQEKEVVARIRIHLELRQARHQLMNQKLLLEETVRERTYDLQQAQKVANIGSWKLDVGDGMFTLSGQSCLILGFRQDDVPCDRPIPLSRWMERIHPDDLQAVNDAWKHALENPLDGFHMVYRIRSHGKLTWIREDARFELNAGNRPVRAIGTVQDITERKNHLEALERQNRALRDIAWTQSHVVRAPLVRLMGLVAVLDDAGFTAMEDEDILREIHRSASELDSIIRDISRKTDSLFKPDQTP